MYTLHHVSSRNFRTRKRPITRHDPASKFPSPAFILQHSSRWHVTSSRLCAIKYTFSINYNKWMQFCCETHWASLSYKIANLPNPFFNSATWYLYKSSTFLNEVERKALAAFSELQRTSHRLTENTRRPLKELPRPCMTDRPVGIWLRTGHWDRKVRTFFRAA